MIRIHAFIPILAIYNDIVSYDSFNIIPILAICNDIVSHDSFNIIQKHILFHIYNNVLKSQNIRKKIQKYTKLIIQTSTRGY